MIETVFVSEKITQPTYRMTLRGVSWDNCAVREIDSLRAIDEDGNAVDEVVAVITMSGKKETYVHQLDNVNFERYEYELIARATSLKQADEWVTRNCMDISEGGIEVYVATDLYVKGEFKERHWYEFDSETSTYQPCSEPEKLALVGTPKNQHGNFSLSGKHEYSCDIGVYS